MPQYGLTFQNMSQNSGSVCIYQTNPDFGPNTLSLAWFAKYAGPNTNVRFDWNDEYSFVWGQTGQLMPGLTFSADQMWPANPSGINKVTFTTMGGGFGFTNQQQGPGSGSIYIEVDRSVPSNQAAVGFGMSGASLFATQAQPNMMVSLTPRPNYWIAFGNFQPGQVLDARSIPNAAQIQFPGGVFNMNATLNPDNSWMIRPS